MKGFLRSCFFSLFFGACGFLDRGFAQTSDFEIRFPGRAVPDSIRLPPVKIEKDSIQFSACFSARIFVLIDWSSSVRGTEKNIINALSSFIDSLSPTWEHDLYFEIIRFGDGHEVLVELTNRPEELYDALFEFGETGAYSDGTLVSSAFLEVKEVFEHLQEEGEGTYRDVVVVISDGKITNKNDEAYALELARHLHSQNVQIYALNTGSNTSNSIFMTEIANAGYFESSIRDLKRQLESLDPCM